MSTLDARIEQRELVAALAGTRTRADYGCCIYCGGPCYGLTCRKHRELLGLDPYLNEARAS